MRFSAGGVTSPIARLLYGSGDALRWSRVLVANDEKTRTRHINQVQVRTSKHGDVYLPSALPPGVYIVDLKFVGDGTITPSVVKYRLTVA